MAPSRSGSTKCRSACRFPFSRWNSRAIGSRSVISPRQRCSPPRWIPRLLSRGAISISSRPPINCARPLSPNTRLGALYATRTPDGSLSLRERTVCDVIYARRLQDERNTTLPQSADNYVFTRGGLHICLRPEQPRDAHHQTDPSHPQSEFRFGFSTDAEHIVRRCDCIRGLQLTLEFTLHPIEIENAANVAFRIAQRLPLVVVAETAPAAGRDRQRVDNDRSSNWSETRYWRIR